MTIIEEKRNHLIDFIQNTDDEEILDIMNEITHNNIKEIFLSDEILNIVEKIDNDMENGEFYTSEEMENIINSWN